MPGSGLTQITRPDGTPLAPMDLPKNVIRTSYTALWSAYQYAAAFALAGRADGVFTVQQGGTGQGYAAPLSIAETNMPESGRLPTGMSHTVMGIALYPYYTGGTTPTTEWAVDGADLRNVDNHLALQWRFLQVFIDICMATMIGAGGGVYGSTADTGAVEGNGGGSRIALNHGVGNVWQCPFPVLLPAATTFAIVYKWGDLAVAVDGGVNLCALNVRTSLIGLLQTASPIG